VTTPAGTRRRDRDATRMRVLQAAVAEFARYGFEGARGERIAERASCSERMLYYYFGSKEGLFREALESVYSELRDQERGLRLDELAPLEALESFCRFVWRYYAEHPEFLSLLNTENLYRARHLKKSSQLLELVSPVVGMLDELLQRGSRQRVFRAGLDPVGLYLAIASLGYFVLSNRHTLSTVLGRDIGEPAYLEQHWEQSVDLIKRYVSA
jgi:AcrR family transcriptional regulator